MSCLLDVQTKNVSGRLLVGLRWWNEVTDEGGNWRFESLAEVLLSPPSSMALSYFFHWHCPPNSVASLQGQRAINSKDSACFWWSLYIMVRSFSTALCCMSRPMADLSRVCMLQPLAWIVMGVLTLVRLQFGKSLKLFSLVGALRCYTTLWWW